MILHESAASYAPHICTQAGSAAHSTSTPPSPRSFLTHSVYDLRSRLQERNSGLSVWAGLTEKVVPAIISALKAQGDDVEAVWMTKEINTEEVNVENKLRKALAGGSDQIPLKTFHSKTLVHPNDLGFLVQDLPDIFTQFRKRVESQGFRNPLDAPDKLKPYPGLPDTIQEGPGVYALDGKAELKDVNGVIEALGKPLAADPSPLNHLKLRSKELEQVPSALPFKGGETEALDRLQHYFAGGSHSPAARYKETRNGLLGVDYSTKVSWVEEAYVRIYGFGKHSHPHFLCIVTTAFPFPPQFSPFLAHGCLSPRLIAQHAHQLDSSTGKGSRAGGGYWIIFELLWRDYFFYVGWKYGSSLFTLKGIEEKLDHKSAASKSDDWVYPSSLDDPSDVFVRWARGETGVPLVDASQKELIQTGFQSNRSRQNVASFLTKDLRFDWRLGAEFFESFLVDYDPNSNYGNWQYVAGVGNDPRSSRQFNQIKQAKDYDPRAEYLTTWLPPLQKLLPEHRNEVFHPWTLATQQGGGSGRDKVPEGYPSEPVVETGMWKAHYQPRGEKKWRGGSGGGGGPGGHGGHGGHGGSGGGGGGQPHRNGNGGGGGGGGGRGGGHSGKRRGSFRGGRGGGGGGGGGQ